MAATIVSARVRVRALPRIFVLEGSGEPRCGGASVHSNRARRGIFLSVLLLPGACLHIIRQHSGLWWLECSHREQVRQAVRGVRGAAGARRSEPMCPAVSASYFIGWRGLFGSYPLFWLAPRCATAFALRPQPLHPGGSRHRLVQDGSCPSMRRSLLSRKCSSFCRRTSWRAVSTKKELRPRGPTRESISRSRSSGSRTWARLVLICA